MKHFLAVIILVELLVIPVLVTPNENLGNEKIPLIPNFWTDPKSVFGSPELVFKKFKKIGFYRMPPDYRGHIEKSVKTSEATIWEYFPQKPLSDEIVSYVEKHFNDGRVEIFYEHENGRWFRISDNDGDGLADSLDSP